MTGNPRKAMSRRDFIQRAAVMGGAVAVGGPVLAACVGDDAATTTAAPGTTATTAAAGSKRGGVLSYAAVAGAPGYDPARWWNGFVWDGVVGVFDPILQATAAGMLAAGLSEVPTIANEGTLYTFNIKQGVMFHHGRVMTADDVKFSLDRLLAPATASEGISLYNTLPIVGLQALLDEAAGDVSGIKVVDDYTLTIELEEPDSALPFVLTLPFASVVPRDVVENVGNDAFNVAPVGTGPYVMKDVDLENGLVMERFEDHWDPTRPYIDRIDWTFGLDPNLAALRIESNELDMMQERIPIGTVEQIRADADLADRLVIGPVNDSKYLTINTQFHEALTDVNVRKAVAMAIDRDRLVRALKSIPTAATGGIFSPLSPYYQEGLALPHDKAAARQLLVDAGYENGFDVNILGQTESPFAEIAQTVQADLVEIGINATADLASVEVFIAGAYTEQPEPLIAYLWDLPYPHGSYLIDGAFTSPAVDALCCNLSSYQSENFDSLARQAHLTTDPDEIVDLYKRMDKKIVQEDVAAVPLFYDSRIEFMSERVRGFEVPSTLSVVHFFRDYWLEDAA